MLKLALPGGRLRGGVGALLQRIGLQVKGYAEGSRSYRLAANSGAPLTARVFREKDIPVQIALGNYDAGICGLTWTEEFLARHPQPHLAKLGGFSIGEETLFVAKAANGAGLPELAQRWGIRIASEYANLADIFALSLRLPGYRVIPVAGSAEAYPPEDAELAIIAAPDEVALRELGLEPVQSLLHSSAWLLVNQESLRSKDLSELLATLTGEVSRAQSPALNLPAPPTATARPQRTASNDQGRPLRLALPDGHQHPHVVKALADAELAIAGYTDTDAPVRRPSSPIAGVEVKLIRPQDMPQMVAAGHFDIAITGRDCILEHLYKFPDSPIEIAVDLQRSPVNMCAVVSADLEAASIEEALATWRSEGRRVIRIASEFTGIADHYAQANHFGRYQVIPTAGASEGFVPEDADLLIEGTETGKTLVENNLKSIEVLFLSTTCVIVRKGAAAAKQAALEQLLAHLRKAAPPEEASAPDASATIQARG